MRLFLLYSLELAIGAFVLLLLGGLYFAYDALLDSQVPQRAEFLAISSPGILFVIGHVYSRLKQRRDERRTMALTLFKEWHSEPIRSARIYLSRWKQLLSEKSGEGLPALSEIERRATGAYFEHIGEEEPPQASSMSAGDAVQGPSHELDDPALQELHAFTVYQYFERWALLLENAELDQYVASRYMGSYKEWYLQEFIAHWQSIETDEDILRSLQKILRLVSRKR
jgi:hypothetical protein